MPVTRGVPQGSVLGPFLFNLFVAHLPRLAAEHAATLFLFADDKTLYSSQLQHLVPLVQLQIAWRRRVCR